MSWTIRSILHYDLHFDMIDKNREQSCYIDEWSYICLNRLSKDVSNNYTCFRNEQMSNWKTVRIHSYIKIPQELWEGSCCNCSVILSQNLVIWSFYVWPWTVFTVMITCLPLWFCLVCLDILCIVFCLSWPCACILTTFLCCLKYMVIDQWLFIPLLLLLIKKRTWMPTPLTLCYILTQLLTFTRCSQWWWMLIEPTDNW